MAEARAPLLWGNTAQVAHAVLADLFMPLGVTLSAAVALLWLLKGSLINAKITRDARDTAFVR